MDQEIKLGDKVRCKVSGYEGIATSRTEFLNGCIQIEVTRKLKKGEKLDAESFAGIGIDVGQLERIGNGINTPKKKVEKKRIGGKPRMVRRNLY